MAKWETLGTGCKPVPAEGYLTISQFEEILKFLNVKITYLKTAHPQIAARNSQNDFFRFYPRRVLVECPLSVDNYMPYSIDRLELTSEISMFADRQAVLTPDSNPLCSL